VLPLSRQRCNHLTAELALRLKLSAASRRDAPAATASITRSRKYPESMPQELAHSHIIGNPRFNSAGKRSKSRMGEPQTECVGRLSLGLRAPTSIFRSSR
jgi:hypothetical protein